MIGGTGTAVNPDLEEMSAQEQKAYSWLRDCSSTPFVRSVLGGSTTFSYEALDFYDIAKQGGFLRRPVILREDPTRRGRSPTRLIETFYPFLNLEEQMRGFQYEEVREDVRKGNSFANILKRVKSQAGFPIALGSTIVGSAVKTGKLDLAAITLTVLGSHAAIRHMRDRKLPPIADKAHGRFYSLFATATILDIVVEKYLTA